MEESKYKRFSHIKIESLDILWGRARNKACYNRIKSNGINTLKDLFEKYDSNSLVFPSFDEEANAQTRALIEIIRYRYLGANLLIDPYLETIVYPFQVINDKSKRLKETVYLGRAIGLERRQAIGLAHYIKDNIKKATKLGDIITDIYKKNKKITNIGINEIDDLRTKLSILVEYYESKQIPKLNYPQDESNKTNLTELLAEKENLITQRDNIDKKIVVIQELIAQLQKEEGIHNVKRKSN